jgi:transcriptional regulator with XRE-family HTH domain
MATDTSPFGRSLRHWRRLRGVSQLELAGLAVTTTRYLSYLETGRARPSQQMVTRLADALQVPLRERNGLLERAGLAPVYQEGDLTADEMAPFGQVIARLLASHDPYPGFAVDRHWNIIEANAGTERFLAGVTERNSVGLVLGPLRDSIDNWQEITFALLGRLSADLMRFPDDPALLALHAEVRAALGDTRRLHPITTGRVICPRFRVDGTLVRTITVAARFESAIDISLDEIRIELIYPADSAAEQFFRDLATS